MLVDLYGSRMPVDVRLQLLPSYNETINEGLNRARKGSSTRYILSLGDSKVVAPPPLLPPPPPHILPPGV